MMRYSGERRFLNPSRKSTSTPPTRPIRWIRASSASRSCSARWARSRSRAICCRCCRRRSAAAASGRTFEVSEGVIRAGNLCRHFHTGGGGFASFICSCWWPTIVGPAEPGRLGVVLGTKPAVRIAQARIGTARLQMIDAEVPGDARADGVLALDVAARRHHEVIGEQGLADFAIAVGAACAAEQGAILLPGAELLGATKQPFQKPWRSSLARASSPLNLPPWRRREQDRCAP